MPEVIFNGPDGRLEGRYHPHKHQTAPLAIILHPHPLHGGSMNNKVVYTLYQSFVRQGYTTLRFNFCGVGRSQRRLANGEGELSDAAAALDWLQGYHPHASRTWVAGFSFGAWVAMQLLMRRPEIRSFIAVSPPTNLYDFSFLAPCPVSGQIIHGNDDQIVPKATVAKLAQKLSLQRGIEIDFRLIDNADHYFTHSLGELSEVTDTYISSMSTPIPLPVAVAGG